MRVYGMNVLKELDKKKIKKLQQQIHSQLNLQKQNNIEKRFTNLSKNVIMKNEQIK